jgi:hypothetical protein
MNLFCDFVNLSQVIHQQLALFPFSMDIGADIQEKVMNLLSAFA